MIRNKYPEGLIGLRFGSLLVVEELSPYLHPRTGKVHGRRYNCLCDCGRTKEVNRVSLVKEGNNSSGKSRSCGFCSHVFPERPIQETMKIYQRNAAKAGREFSLSAEEFGKIISQDCFYCGKPPVANNKKFVDKNRNFKRNGIDRVNNSLGYVAGNVLPCCFTCNRAKMKMSVDEFLNWVKEIYERHVNGIALVRGV